MKTALKTDDDFGEVVQIGFRVEKGENFNLSLFNQSGDVQHGSINKKLLIDFIVSNILISNPKNWKYDLSTRFSSDPLPTTWG